jgi:hypothetical protein
MKYYKQWKGHPEKLKKEGEPVGWFEVDEIFTLQALEGNIKTYKGIDASPSEINTMLSNGQILHSSCAMYIGIP